MHTKRFSGGFTLVEILIVVAIVAIIASIAYPSYQDSITRSRRVAAAACLTETAHNMERGFTVSMKYPTTLPAISCMNETAGFYTYALDASASSNTAFKVQATPVGPQDTADSAKCGVLSLDHKGVRAASGSQGVDTCWK